MVALSGGAKRTGITLREYVWTVCVVLILLGGHSFSYATRWVPETVICPLDQVSFTADVLTSRTSFISDYRLDGRPVGPGSGPWPLSVCPHNGFVFAGSDSWEDGQLEKLRDFVGRPIYQEAMGDQETYYRLARIYEFLGEPPERIADAYLSASWQTPYDDDVLFAREFILMSRDETDLLAAQGHYLWYVDQALTYYRLALQQGHLSEVKAVDVQFKCLELSRLVGRFGEAQTHLRMLQETRNRTHAPDGFDKLLNYEATLIRNRDIRDHTMKEATTASKLRGASKVARK